MGVVRYTQRTENDIFKFVYLKKEVVNEVHFSHADTHSTFLQLDTIIFDGDCWVCQKY